MTAMRSDWAGAAVFVLSLGISIGFAATLVAGIFIRDAPVTAQAAAMLATIGGAMAGAIATYVGGAYRRNGAAGLRSGPPSDERAPAAG